jgi:hypothetical protein
MKARLNAQGVRIIDTATEKAHLDLTIKICLAQIQHYGEATVSSAMILADEILTTYLTKGEDT